MEDHASLRRIFQHSPWEIHGVFTARDGLDFVREHSLIPVVICENSLPDGDWRFVLKGLGRAPGRPVVIVATPLADERLWVEVLNLGAFDLLLAAPFEAAEVIRVTESAWLAWNRACGRMAIPRIGPDLAWSPDGAGQSTDYPHVV